MQRKSSRLAPACQQYGTFRGRTAFSGKCDGWLDDLRSYLTANRDFLVEYVTENMPDVRLTVPQATYLAWLISQPIT